MLTLLSLLAVGFALGMRHAMDADHVLAVATIVTRERTLRAAAGIGILWGIGHSLTVFGVGAAILLFELVIPPRLGMAMEFGVGVMLLVLGASALRTAWRHAGEGGGLLPAPAAADAGHEVHYAALGPGGLAQAARGVGLPALAGLHPGQRGIRMERDAAPHAHVHAHGDFMHTHSHRHGSGGHGHLDQDTLQARLDSWFGGLTLYQVLRPLLVGVVHGMAGSAAVALLVLAAVGNAAWGFAFLAVFGIGTTAGMMVITLLMAAPIALWGHSRALRTGLTGIAGVASVAFGLFLMHDIAFTQGLLAPAGAIAAGR